MVESTHWEECWKVHHSCALARISHLEETIDALQGELFDAECKAFGCHDTGELHE